MTSRQIRVLVVDDSAVVRRLVSETLSQDPEIVVVGTAIDPYAAREKIVSLKPDVLTLDLEMPRMDGLTFLRILMTERPMPVVIMSSLTQSGSHQAIEALRLGAVDVLAKPGGPYSFGDIGPQLLAKVKAAAQARLKALLPPGSTPETPRAAPPVQNPIPPPAPVRKPVPLAPASVSDRRLIVLGASTGGTEALRHVLTRLPAELPPVAIVQHIPATFSRAFADRLNTLCRLTVREATDGEPLVPGLALVAPGNYHMLVHWSGGCYRVKVTDGPRIWHQRPAVDLLFKSAAEAAGSRVVAGVLTGMGKDGAEGLLRLRQAGAVTFAQDEASCVVYGMPRAAWELGAAQRQASLDEMPELILRSLAAIA
ncbi:chemotaxis response regulator protein-glutamate methylesterase [Termitidicoccus mucosus]|uniref:Protein-glutamate methylesterase/protein-glutamine glutaminase n=1 Tax=Termitidicoccus mucosus TaxID=1184151 RepID=A0A178IF18_9BACT|nr:chemotaxis response regulator protein-glutamate methylesterase [Opitutaceae bacterium TSB47]